MTSLTIQTDKFLLNRQGAAAVLDMSVRNFDKLRAAGKIGPKEIRLDGMVLFSAQELAEWCRANCPNRVEWVRGKQLQPNRS